MDVEVYDRLIQVQPTSWIERVDDHISVLLPGVKTRDGALGEESVGLDAASSRIVAGNDDFSGEEVVREPDLVLRDEPVRVVAQVELPEGFTRIGRGDLKPRDVVLDMSLPCQVGSGV